MRVIKLLVYLAYVFSDRNQNHRDMKTYNIFQEAIPQFTKGLATDDGNELAVDFLVWMAREFPNYLRVEAHDEADLMTFVNEFLKSRQ